MVLFKNNMIFFLKLILLIFFLIILILVCNNQISRILNFEENDKIVMDDELPEYIVGDVVVKDIDGTNYEFFYNGENFIAVYTNDHWKIYNSYKIKNENDIKKICQALIDIHPIHGRDMVSYRTADDMAYEWLQHNIAYVVLPSDNEWRDNARDVDLDPFDQGKTFREIYEDRVS